MMKSVILATVAAIASAQTVEFKCKKVTQSCIMSGHTLAEVSAANPGVDVGKLSLGKCCDGLKCAKAHKFSLVGKCAIPATTTTPHPKPTKPVTVCAADGMSCGNTGTNKEHNTKCCNGLECTAAKGDLLGRPATCQQPKCAKKGKFCGHSGVNKNEYKNLKCCDKSYECRIVSGDKVGRDMTCQKKHSKKCAKKGEKCGNSGTEVSKTTKCCDKDYECVVSKGKDLGRPMVCQKKQKKCAKKGKKCGNSGTEVSKTMECCDSDYECVVSEGKDLGRPMVCQKKQKKCAKNGEKCGNSGTEKSKTMKCCDKDSECVVSKGKDLGRPMVCQKKSTTTSSAPAPTCTVSTGYMGPVQIRTEDCASKVNNSIVFNTSCCDVKYNKTSQWYIYFTTGCGNTEFQLVNGADQGSACNGNLDTSAYFAASDISYANQTIFESRNNYVDTFTLNFVGTVLELSQTIVNQTEAAVTMMIQGDNYLNVNETNVMYTSVDSTTFNIGVLSAFDVYFN